MPTLYTSGYKYIYYTLVVERLKLSIIYTSGC